MLLYVALEGLSKVGKIADVDCFGQTTTTLVPRRGQKPRDRTWRALDEFGIAWKSQLEWLADKNVSQSPCLGLKGMVGREKFQALRINADADKCVDRLTHLSPLVEGGDCKPMCWYLHHGRQLRRFYSAGIAQGQRRRPATEPT